MLSSINGFIKEGASHALRHGISDLQTKAEHYRDKLREHLAEAQSEVLFFLPDCNSITTI